MTLNRSKLYNFDLLKAWDYGRTIVRSEKLRIAYIKRRFGCKRPSCVLWKKA